MAISMPTLGRMPQLGKAATPRSAPEKIWLAGAGVVAALLILIGYFAFIHGQQAETSSTQGKITDARQQNAALEARINQLRSQNKNLASYEAALAKARLALPTTAGVSDFLRTLQSMGSATSTTVTAVSVSAPAVVTPASAAPAAAGTSAAPAPAAAAAVTGPQLYSMAITAQVTGSSAGVIAFLKQLQAVQPRAVLLTSVTQSSGGGSGGAPGAPSTSGATTLALSMSAFLAPTNVTAPAGATPTGATPTASK